MVTSNFRRLDLARDGADEGWEKLGEVGGGDGQQMKREHPVATVFHGTQRAGMDQWMDLLDRA